MIPISNKLELFVNKVDPKLVNSVAWLGTSCLLFSPYLLSYQIGFILGAVGVALITPPCIVNKQWNLVILNFSSFIGYSLQVFNVI